ncbi:hypothetical protein HPP92_003643 [Vanilla planifolia]|uniref:Carboxypeptidase n=1 Tax=Vanilla planifolia TaxID=51239 RepID=A0A835S410_VANPL|nr:hypothetical protein HPP92_003643 [Vanilla planifolia]
MNYSFSSLIYISCFLFSVLFITTAHANQGNTMLAWSKTRLLHRLNKSNSSYVLDARKITHQTYSSSAFLGSQKGLRKADEIKSLPGQPLDVNFKQYGGYVTVDAEAGRALFYYFVEATHDSHIKPLVLWLNGGPGCSSIGGGAMMELGSFFVNKDGKTLYKNKYAWNNEANMLFLESPAGVGFSYSNRTADYYQNGDASTANDNYNFLIGWLERFPHYKHRDFYITGESYAGHYIPQLANFIIRKNYQESSNFINLKGVAGTYDYLWNHALISPATHDRIMKKCDFLNGNYSAGCVKAMHEADEVVGHIDYYNIYASLCKKEDVSKSTTNEPVNPADPCGELYVKSYLNLPEVQRALHANITGLDRIWTDCSNIVNPSNWLDSPSVMLPEIQKLVTSGIRLWLYSGDVDSVVPFTATQYSLDMLKLPIETPWRAWYTNQEVGGYTVGYKGCLVEQLHEPGFSVVIGNGNGGQTTASTYRFSSDKWLRDDWMELREWEEELVADLHSADFHGRRE